MMPRAILASAAFRKPATVAPARKSRCGLYTSASLKHISMLSSGKKHKKVLQDFTKRDPGSCLSGAGQNLSNQDKQKKHSLHREVISVMLSATFMLLVSSAMMMLRLGDNVSSFPRPLKPQEEQEYVCRSLEGDMEARNKLIEHNLRLVMHIIKKYYTTSADTEDLVSIGTIGLIKGVSTYRPDKGVRLATYASKCIENAILSPKRFHGKKKHRRQPATRPGCLSLCVLPVQ